MRDTLALKEHTDFVNVSKSDLLSSQNASDASTNFEQIALAPAINNAFIQPANAFVSGTNYMLGIFTKSEPLPHITEMTVAKTDFLSLPWFVEGVSGGLGALGPYLIAGKFASGALRGAGAELNLSGATARFLQKDATAQIVGAALYDGMRDPKTGETRLGNALGGAAAFSIFYLGNSLRLGSNLPGSSSLTGELIKRSVVGATGAAAQQIVSTEVSDRTMPTWNALYKASVSGMVLNMVMPEAQKAAGTLIDSATTSMGIGLPIDRYLNNQLAGKSVQEFSPDIAQIQEAFPWARIRTGGQVIDFNSKPSEADAAKFSLAQSAAQLKGILSTTKPSIGLDVMMNTGQLPALIPEMVPMAGPKGLQDPRWHSEGTAWQHTKMVEDKLAEGGQSGDQTMMVTGLLHDVAKPLTQIVWPDGGISNKTHDTVGAPIAKEVAERLGLPQSESEKVFNLVAQHERMHHVQKMNPAELTEILRNPQIKDLIELQHADSQGRASVSTSQREFLQKKLDEMSIASPKPNL